jgi:RNA polymerase sigma factor (sigma-70 family)
VTIDSLIGRKLSHYRVVRKIGEGGMGVVYQARDPRLERDVALKILATGTLVGPDARKRFRREALALSTLNHPNIATVYDFDSGGDVDFLVMEMIHGGTLAERLRGGALPAVQALEIVTQIAEALEFAHAQGVIHRDLKPRNIMVTATGFVKVLDFGLARRRGARVPKERGEKESRGFAALLSSHAMGTPGYMSPEQVRGLSQDSRTDIFAFGCVLFECLAGMRAYEGKTAEDVISAVLTGDPRWSALPDGVPPRLRRLLERCLEKDQAKRLFQIGEARSELEAMLGTRRHIPLRFHRSRSPSPNNLPSSGTSFIGRDAEVAECRSLLGRTRLLTLTGAGGCGKTRLAVEIGASMLAEFPDGVWFTDLASIHEDARVFQAVAVASGVREDPERPLIDALVAAHREKKTLLILDNCDGHLRPCADLAHAILRSCPGVTLLATSREALRTSGEHLFLVPPLQAVESVRLFAARAASAKPGFAITDRDAPAVADICRRLDGIPLAIELAASRVAVLTPEEIRAKLDHRFRLLTTDRPEAPARHQTLRAAIEWSYDLLTPDERDLFAALSVFEGGCTLESAASVCGGTRDEFVVLDLFTRLLDKSLLVAETAEDETPRYRYLETIREYALEKLALAGTADDLRRRHRDYFLALAETAAPELTGPHQASWLARLDADHENLLMALRTGAQAPGAVEGLRLAAALWRFWVARGHIGVGLDAIHAALRADGAGSSSLARAVALTGGGALAFHRNDWAQGEAYCDEALAIFTVIEDAPGMAAALVARGNFALGQGDYATARSYYDRGLEKYREAGQRRGMGVALSNSGRAAELQGDDAAASRLYEEGLALFREVGDLSSTALRLSSLGYLFLRLGDPARARERLVECLQLVLELKEMRAAHFALERSAALLERSGYPREAAVLCAAAEVSSERAGSPLTPRERTERDALIGRLRAELGPSFEKAWLEGRALKGEQALERARTGLEERDVSEDAARWKDKESTANLLEDIRGGDAAATARLVKRYLPILRRWAHGRLPQKARDLADTDDLVQVALIRGLAKLQGFEQRRTGAFLAYMRQIVRNQIRDEIRKPGRERIELPEDLPDGGASPLEEAIGRESLECYQAALQTLSPKQREAVVMRLEMGFSYREIAETLGRGTEEGVRISVRRGLERLRQRLPEFRS